jgi:hypothetical protein
VDRIPRYRRRDDGDRERVLADGTSKLAYDKRTVVLIARVGAGIVDRDSHRRRARGPSPESAAIDRLELWRSIMMIDLDGGWRS